jgi:sugar O-acyltransferase (sialic acid O-acetyltransferase NeuD family)
VLNRKLMSKRLAIFGASGHGKVVADAALAAGWQDVLFFDDAWPSLSRVDPWYVGGDMQLLFSSAGDFDGVIVAIGNCEIRAEKHQALLSRGVRLTTIVHPRSWVSPYASLGMGCVVMAGAIVNAGACIGNAAIVNTGATVDHDCVLEDAVHISPGAHLAGNVHVGSMSWIGIGAAVRQGIVIGSRAMVGAGAVVVKPVPDGVTVVGNPASPMKRAPASARALRNSD